VFLILSCFDVSKIPTESLRKGGRKEDRKIERK
jgi:hypothetical protein